MKLSKLFFKTYKDIPKDSEVVSHQLMLRSSMIKQVSRGIYSYLPLGYSVLRNIENIVREEMVKAGAQEVHLPVLAPATLWQETSRWYDYGPELMRLSDRSGRDFVLGPTHEEVITDIVRNMINSYKDVPFNLFQIQTKFRDELRPRFGLMRGREFLMKDAYSFHLTDESLDIEYHNMKKAYENIFKRCGLNFRAVEADSGSIGGDVTHEFMVLSDSGEDDIVFCDTCSYAANIEKAVNRMEYATLDEKELDLEMVETLNKTSIEEVANYLNVSIDKSVKAVLLKEVLEDSTNYVMALIRGDLDVNIVKVKNLVGAIIELNLMDESDCKTLGIIAGYASCINLNVNIKVVIDESVLHMKNFVAGANKAMYHYINANISDLEYDIVGDIRVVKESDKCPKCNGHLHIKRGIEVGHIFKLGQKYASAMDATVLNEQGKKTVLTMGCYGIGISRVMAATIEQYHDENGIIWPLSIAPYHVNIIIGNVKDETQVNLANKLYEQLLSQDVLVLLDDRNERMGFKLKDSDLIGIPYKIIVGKYSDENIVEFKSRTNDISEEINVDEVINKLQNLL